MPNERAFRLAPDALYSMRAGATISVPGYRDALKMGVIKPN
jgi:hypothetical protein